MKPTTTQAGEPFDEALITQPELHAACLSAACGCEQLALQFYQALLPLHERREQDLGDARATIKRLNRRCQQAEAALADYQRIVAVTPDEKGLRWVSGSLGRAFLAYENAKLEARLAIAQFKLGMGMTILRRAREFGLTGKNYSARIALDCAEWIDGGMRFPLPDLPPHIRERFVEEPVGKPPAEEGTSNG